MSDNQRRAFQKAKDPNGKFSDDMFYFFSGEKIEDAAGLPFGNGTIRYDANEQKLYLKNSQIAGNSDTGYGKFEYGGISGGGTTTDAEVKIVNTYAPKNISITVTKTVTGNGGDTAKEFQFIMTDQDGTQIQTFSLSNGGKQEDILIPYGHTVTITETDADNYSLSVNGTVLDGHTYTYTADGASPLLLEFVNDLTVPPDMGVTLDALPYALILLGVGAGAAVVLLRRKRRDDDDDGEEW